MQSASSSGNVCAAHRELSPPTAIEHSVSANFTGEHHINLIVAKTSILEIYRLRPNESNMHQSKLYRCGQYHLYGTIETMQAVRIRGDPRDSLLVGFSDARMSVLYFDTETYGLTTTSLHAFDEGSQVELPKYDFQPYRPTLSVDPLNRCAAMLALETKLVIFPLTRRLKSANLYMRPHLFEAKDTKTVTVAAAQSTPSSARTLSSFVIDMDKQLGIKHIRDIVFLHSYSDPTFLVLWEDKLTCPGRYAVREFSCRLTTVTVNLESKEPYTIAQCSNLPHDAATVYAIPEPIGGSLIFCSNLIIHFNNQGINYALSLNDTGDQYYHAAFLGKSEVTCLLGRPAKAVFLAPDRMFVSLSDGQLFLLSIFPQGQSVRDLNLIRIGQSSIPCCITNLTDRFFFLGSRLGHSMLIEYERIIKDEEDPYALEVEEMQTDTDSKVGSEEGSDKNKRVRLMATEETDAFKDHADLIDSELSAVYGASFASASSGPTSKEYAFTVHDRLFNLGPIGDFALGMSPLLAKIPTTSEGDDDAKSSSSSETSVKSENEAEGTARGKRLLEEKKILDRHDPVTWEKERSPMVEIVSCSGHLKDGHICIASQGIVPEIITTFALERVVNGCWTVCIPEESKKKKKDLTGRKRKRGLKEYQAEKQKEKEFDSFLLISCSNSTMVLSTGVALEEAEDTDFFLDGSTLCVGNITLFASSPTSDSVAPLPAIAQIYKQGLRILQGKAGKLVQEIPIPDASSVIQARVLDPFVIMLMSDGTLRLISTKPSAQAIAEAEKEDDKKDNGDSMDTDEVVDFDDDAQLELEWTMPVLAPIRVMQADGSYGSNNKSDLTTSSTDSKTTSNDTTTSDNENKSALIINDIVTALAIYHDKGWTGLFHQPKDSSSDALTHELMHEEVEDMDVLGVGIRNKEISAAAKEERRLSSIPKPQAKATKEDEALYDNQKMDLDESKNDSTDSGMNVDKDSDDDLFSPEELGDGPSSSSSSSSSSLSSSSAADDEDDELAMLLYGDDDEGSSEQADKDKSKPIRGSLLSSSSPSSTSSSSSSSSPDDAPLDSKSRQVSRSSKLPRFEASDVCIICRANALEIYQLPSFELIFTCPSFSSGPTLLTNHITYQVPGSDSNDNGNKKNNKNNADDSSLSQGVATTIVSIPKRSKLGAPPKVVEVGLFDLGTKDNVKCPPFLIALLSTGDLLVYHAFRYHDPNKPQDIGLRFLKVKHNYIGRQPKSAWYEQDTMSNGAYRDRRLDLSPPEPEWHGSQRLVPFDNLCGRKSVLLNGNQPALLFAERDFFRLHLFAIDEGDPGRRVDIFEPNSKQVFKGAVGDNKSSKDNHSTNQAEEQEDLEPVKVKSGVNCGTPFHNVNCGHGMVYFDTFGNINIARIPELRQYQPHSLTHHHHHPSNPNALAMHETVHQVVNFDHPLTLRSVHLGCTPHFIVRHEPTQTYAVIMSRKFKLMSQEEVTDRSIDIYEDRYELLLYDSSWRTIGRWDGLEEHEVVLCANCVRLFGKWYIVLGTSNHQGPDNPCRGRVILLELYMRKSPVGSAAAGGAAGAAGAAGENKKETLKLKTYNKTEKGPVTALAAVDDLLCLCVGPRLTMYEWEEDDEKLTARAFFDAEHYVVSIQVIRNFILFGDVSKSIYLLLWDRDMRSLTLMGSDLNQLDVYATEFVVNGPNVSFLVSDHEKNIQLFRYLPNRGDSFRGKRLLPRADMHVGHRINKFRNLKYKRSGWPNRPKRPPAGYTAPPRGSSIERFGRRGHPSLQTLKAPSHPPPNPVRTISIGGTLDGGYIMLTPVDDPIYRRLYSLFTQLNYCLPHHAGLGPIGYRLMRPRTNGPHMKNHKRIVDFVCLEEFLQLDSQTQAKLCNQIGTNPAQVIDNLLQLNLNSRLF